MTVKFSKEEEELLRTQDLARIATLSADGYPHIAAMWYAFDGKYVYIATDSTSKKIANIERNSRVAVLVDNQDWHKPEGIMIQGTSEVLKKGDAGFEEGHNLIIVRFPDEKAYDSGKQRILRVTPKKTAHWKFKPKTAG
jgi:PPOX class probable F420-dependent enzyme